MQTGDTIMAVLDYSDGIKERVWLEVLGTSGEEIEAVLQSNPLQGRVREGDVVFLQSRHVHEVLKNEEVQDLVTVFGSRLRG